MIKKYLSITIFIIVTLVIITTLLNFIVNMINYDPYWFMKLSSIATALAAVGSITLLAVTFIYVLTTRQMVEEMRKQREILESPALSLKIVPDKVNFNFLNLVLKNTGGGTAYNVSANFSPDLPYSKSKTVNQLNIFNELASLDKGEEIELFFASTIDYFKSDYPKESVVSITYYKNQKNAQSKIYPVIIKQKINIEERKGQLFVGQKNLNDLVNEMEELKQGILLLLSKKEDE